MIISVKIISQHGSSPVKVELRIRSDNVLNQVLDLNPTRPKDLACLFKEEEEWDRG